MFRTLRLLPQQMVDTPSIRRRARILVLTQFERSFVPPARVPSPTANLIFHRRWMLARASIQLRLLSLTERRREGESDVSERAIDDVGMSPTACVRARGLSASVSVCDAPIRCLCATIVLRRSDSANRRSAPAGIAPDNERKSSLAINGGSHFVARCYIILQGIHFQKAI